MIQCVALQPFWHYPYLHICLVREWIEWNLEDISLISPIMLFRNHRVNILLGVINPLPVTLCFWFDSVSARSIWLWWWPRTCGGKDWTSSCSSCYHVGHNKMYILLFTYGEISYWFNIVILYRNLPPELQQALQAHLLSQIVNQVFALTYWASKNTDLSEIIYAIKVFLDVQTQMQGQMMSQGQVPAQGQVAPQEFPATVQTPQIPDNPHQVFDESVIQPSTTQQLQQVYTYTFTWY